MYNEVMNTKSYILKMMIIFTGSLNNTEITGITSVKWFVVIILLGHFTFLVLT